MKVKNEKILINGEGMSDENIVKLEIEYDVKFPMTYKGILKEYGYLILDDCYIDFSYNDFKDKICITDILGNSEKANFEFYNKNFKEELPPKFFIMGVSEDGKFVLDSETESVYFWDDFRIFEISDDTQNLYQISKSFDEFINVINEC